MFKALSTICVLVICSNAFGIINMQLPPRQLLESSEMVIVGTVVKDGENWKLRVDDAIKGKPSAAFVLDLSKCDKDQVEEIRTLLTENISRPAVMITGKRLVGN